MGQVQSPGEGCGNESCPICYPHRPLPIQESTRVSSDKFTIGREGFAIRREASGYALRFPEGSVPPGVDVTVTVYRPDPKAYSVPEGNELVSGVCHILSNREIELERSGSGLALDHCINVGNAEDRDSVSVFTYNERGEGGAMDERDIDVQSDCVWVKLKKLGSWFYGIVFPKKRRGAVRYCGVVYRLQLEANLISSMKFFFMVVKELTFYVKVQLYVLTTSLLVGYAKFTVSY